MVGVSKVVQCRIVAIVLVVAAMTVAGATYCCCWRRVTTSTDVIVLLGAGCVSVSLLATAILAIVISGLEPAESYSALGLLSHFLLQTLISLRGRLVLRRLRQASTHLAAAQSSVLLSILRRNAKTTFGRRNHFADVLHGADAIRRSYVASVPLTTYDDYAEDIQRLLESTDAPTAGILAADPVEFLSYTSGTTGKKKLIPLTRWTKTTAATVVRPLTCHVLDRALGGRRRLHRVVDVSYRSPITRSPSGLGIGSIGGYIGRRAPYVVSPPAVFSVTHEPTAMHVHALFALSERQVDRLEAMLSTMIYAFWAYVERHWKRICDEIEHGTLIQDNIADPDTVAAAAVVKDTKSMESVQSTSDLDATLMASVAEQLRADKPRADELRRIFASGFVGVARRVWPGLRAVRMLATGGFAGHARLLADTYMQGVTQLSLVHAASEGFYGVNVTASADNERPKSLGPNSMYTLLPQLGFYEFIRLADVDKRQPSTLFADQVERAEMYEMVYTSQTGLYRYRTGDIIKVVDFFRQSPIYEFQFRLSQTLNVSWEKTPESVLYASVQAAIDSIDDLRLIDFTSTENICLSHLPEYRCATKCYVLFVEVATRKGCDVILTDDCKSKFDAALQETFELYSHFRAVGSIDSMRVHQVARGSFQRLRRLMTSSQSPSSSSSSSTTATYNPQYKVPRVVRNRAYLDLLLATSLSSSTGI